MTLFFLWYSFIPAYAKTGPMSQGDARPGINTGILRRKNLSHGAGSENRMEKGIAQQPLVKSRPGTYPAGHPTGQPGQVPIFPHL